MTTTSHRMCEEHPDCSLKSVDGGPWEHFTKSKKYRSVGAPMGVVSDTKIEEALDRVQDKAESVVSKVAHDALGGIPQVIAQVAHGVIAEGLRNKELKYAKEHGLKVWREAHASVEREIVALERRLRESITAERATLEASVEHALAVLAEAKRNTEQTAADFVNAVLKVQGEMGKRVDELRRELDKERTERVAATLKEQRQVRNLAGRIEAVRDG